MEFMDHDNRRSQAALEEYLNTIQTAQDKFLAQQPNHRDIYAAFYRSNEISTALLAGYDLERLRHEQRLVVEKEWDSQEHADTTMEDWTDLVVGDSVEEASEEVERLDEETDQSHEDQQAPRSVEGVDLTEGEIAALTISPTHHNQLLGMFGENYPL
ncbi:MAG: hypothetical protein Q9228_007968, partial [Teloschistes exilis]